MKTVTALATFVALACCLAACGKKDETAKSTTAYMPPAATAPATATQPSAATPAPPAPQGSGSVTPRNLAFGTAIAADKKVSVATDTLTLKETAYVSIDLFGAGEAKVKALWTYKDREGRTQLVKDDNETFSVKAPITIEFHVAKPEGLVPAAYEVALFVNDAPIGGKKFTVK